MRLTAPLFATLRAPWERRVVSATGSALKSIVALRPKDTNEWDNNDASALGIYFVPARSADAFCSSFSSKKAQAEAQVEPEAEAKGEPQAEPFVKIDEAAMHMIDLEKAPHSSRAGSIRQWLNAITESRETDGEGGVLESIVDHLVGEVLHASGLDGNGLLVLPQRNIRAKIYESVITTRPDFVVRDQWADPIVHVMTHDSKAKTDGDLCWAQVGAEMFIAALSNTTKLALETGTMHMVGVRAIETRFTFFKAAFDVAALMRLRTCESAAGDHFPIACWGGDFVDRMNQRAKINLSWGLDFRVAAERKKIVLMLLALRDEILAHQRERCLPEA